MCSVLLMPDGTWIDTIGELRETWPGGLVFDGGYAREALRSVGDDCCLCPVDLPATADRHGASLRYDAERNRYLVLTTPAPQTPSEGGTL